MRQLYVEILAAVCTVHRGDWAAGDEKDRKGRVGACPGDKTESGSLCMGWLDGAGGIGIGMGTGDGGGEDGGWAAFTAARVVAVARRIGSMG